MNVMKISPKHHQSLRIERSSWFACASDIRYLISLFASNCLSSGHWNSQGFVASVQHLLDAFLCPRVVESVEDKKGLN